MSPFRETVSIVAASVTSELVVLTAFAVTRILLPSITPDVGAFIRHGCTYLRGSPSHHSQYGTVAAWAVGLLAVAALLAYFATVPRVRRLAEKVTGPYPHDSTVSAWWILFERWKGGRSIEVICILDDGSSVRGGFASFNIAADDSPDRDLILQSPIYYAPTGGEEESYDVSSVCIAARRIVSMFVNYVEIPAEASPSSASGGVAEALGSSTAAS